MRPGSEPQKSGGDRWGMAGRRTEEVAGACEVLEGLGEAAAVHGGEADLEELRGALGRRRGVRRVLRGGHGQAARPGGGAKKRRCGK